MSPEYRTPDPWALKNRLGIKITAALVAIISLATMIRIPTDTSLDLYLILVLAADGGLYGWLYQKWMPTPGDYIDYLETRAEDKEQQEWVLQVEQDFHQLWSLDPNQTTREVLGE